MSDVKMKVYRFNPDTDSLPRFQDYLIPYSSGLSVLQAVRYIYENLDSTLAFRDYHCGRGLCGSCLLNINGKTQKSCRALVKEDEEYTIEPASGYPVIRDIVVDFGMKHTTEQGEKHTSEGQITIQKK